jgi:hypothetical protein
MKAMLCIRQNFRVRGLKDVISVNTTPFFAPFFLEKKGKKERKKGKESGHDTPTVKPYKILYIKYII